MIKVNISFDPHRGTAGGGACVTSRLILLVTWNKYVSELFHSRHTLRVGYAIDAFGGLLLVVYTRYIADE